jgi:hypothetical protein
MKPSLRAPAAAVFVLLVSAGTAAAAGPTVESVEFGIFKTSGVRHIPMPHSVTGEMNLVSHVHLLRTAAVIAAQPGRSFGWRYRYHGLPAGAVVTMRTLHPALTNPKTGKTMRISERRVRIDDPDHIRYTGYTFDYAWEMAEGPWLFQILYRGRVIGQRRFKIVVPLN